MKRKKKSAAVAAEAKRGPTPKEGARGVSCLRRSSDQTKLSVSGLFRRVNERRVEWLVSTRLLTTRGGGEQNFSGFSIFQ